jgi:hypothetical protein
VKELCTRYLADLQVGLILGKGGRPKKPSTITTDTGRIERRIIPLLGPRRVKDLSKIDINKGLKDIMVERRGFRSRPKSCAERPSSEAALERLRAPLVSSAAFSPTPSKPASLKATRLMASVSQRTMDSRTAAKHLIVVDASGLVIPFGLERGLRGYRECREGSRGSDAGPCPRHVLTGGLVRLH